MLKWQQLHIILYNDYNLNFEYKSQIAVLQMKGLRRNDDATKQYCW